MATNGHTCGSSPSRDAAGMVRLKELGGPGNTDGTYGRVFLHTFLLKGKLLQLHQSNVVLIVAGVVPAGHLKNYLKILPILLPFNECDCLHSCVMTELRRFIVQTDG